MDCERSPMGGEGTGAIPTGPPMDREGPSMEWEGTGTATLKRGSKATAWQDGDKYTELALDLPPPPYMAPSASLYSQIHLLG